MKKGIISILLSTMVLLSGCSNALEEYDKFSDDIKNEQYLHALSTYENNKDDEEFKTRADDLISFEMLVVKSNLTEENLKATKKFRDFAEEILGSESVEKLDASIEKMEAQIYGGIIPTDTDSESDENEIEEDTSSTEESSDTQEENSSDDETVDTTNFTYSNYENMKYKYKINYPNYLKGDKPQVADTVTLSANNDSVKLVLEASNNTSGISVSSSYKEYLAKSEGVTYQYSNSRMFVVSGIQSDGTSYYHYEAIGSGSINSFTFSWPTKDTHYKEVVQELYDSFKTPSLDTTH